MEEQSWIDEKLSSDLPNLRSRGEGQHIEFKEIFPKNTSDLAKEVAAFATSNQGTILIGVSDLGDLVGIEGLEDQKERDNLLRRLEGICRGTVKPAITPVVKFAAEDGLIVLVMNIPQGKQPIYYSNKIPYVRHLTESRPADPHEVIELVTDYLNKQDIGSDDKGDDTRSDFYSDLARIIGEALIYADQAPDREVNPWLDQWRSEFGYAADELRELSAQNVAIEDNLDKELLEVAKALDDVSNLKLTLGCGSMLDKLTSTAKVLLLAIKKNSIDSVDLSDDSLSYIRDTIIANARKIRELANRSDELIQSGNIEELQDDASDLGHNLLLLTQYNIVSLGEHIKNDVTTIARSLHLIETRTIYMDGGRSMQAIVDEIAEAADSLENITDKFDSK